MFGINALNSKP